MCLISQCTVATTSLLYHSILLASYISRLTGLPNMDMKSLFLINNVANYGHPTSFHQTSSIKNENLYKNIQRHHKLVAAHNIKQTGLLRVASQQHIILIITIAWYREN